MFGRLKDWLRKQRKPEVRQPHCRSCGAAVGDFHALFCTREICPFCGDFISTCDCIFEVLKLNSEERKAVEEYIDDSVEPLLGITRRWEAVVKAADRIPFA
jgi:hypothetical protein